MASVCLYYAGTGSAAGGSNDIRGPAQPTSGERLSGPLQRRRQRSGRGLCCTSSAVDVLLTKLGTLWGIWGPKRADCTEYDAGPLESGNILPLLRRLQESMAQCRKRGQRQPSANGNSAPNA